MEWNIRGLRAHSQQSLDRCGYSPKRLMLVHTGVALGLTLVLIVLDYFLDQSISSTGGLGGIGTRTTLETLRSLLQVTNALLLPFWEIGLTYAMLRIIRHQPAEPRQLLTGFGLFGPVLRANILRWAIYFAVLMLGMQLASTLYLLTPWGTPLLEAVEQMMNTGVTDPYTILTEELTLKIAATFLPMLLVVCLVLLVPVLYRLRMMDYCLLDSEHPGAFRALGMSLVLTRKKCWRLAKLDLSFWWFYALEALAVTICYGDLLLALCGIRLPMDASVASLLFFLAGACLQLGVYVWKRDLVAATYAAAYEALLPPPETDAVML